MLDGEKPCLIQIVSLTKSLMLYTVHGLVDPYLSNTLDVLLYDEVHWQQFCSNWDVPTFNLVEIALRQLLQICYETKGVVCLLCLGIPTSLSALLGLKLAYFLQELQWNHMGEICFGLLVDRYNYPFENKSEFVCFFSVVEVGVSSF